jgi:hypothetical protein
MAISLGVGTIVSAIVILILVPVAFVLIEESTRRRDESGRQPELSQQTVPESEAAVAAR